jgi:hypothetical protein
MRVLINGTDLGRTPLDNFETEDRDEIILPPGTLKYFRVIIFGSLSPIRGQVLTRKLLIISLSPFLPPRTKPGVQAWA